MIAPTTSLLVIAPDDETARDIGSVLSHDPALRIETRTSTLAEMNGKAFQAQADFDVILFKTSPDDESDLLAIQALTAERRAGATLIALANGSISLRQARALSDAGVDEVLPLPLDPGAISHQIARRNRAAPNESQAAARSGRIIAVAQARGGVGSTTVALNLADQLLGGRGLLRKSEKHKVALVDFDLQFGTVGSFLDLPEQDTLLQLAMDGTVPDATFLAQSVVSLPNGLTVLAAPSRFAPIDCLRPEQVAAILDTLRASHDYVIVDLPRALVGWIEPIVQRADELMVVTDVSVSSVRHCRRLIDFFTQNNLALPVEVVVNHQRKPLFPSRLHREAAKALDRKLEHWLPHDPRAACAAADRGQPLSAIAPRSALTKAMSRLAVSTLKTVPGALQANRK